MRIRVSKNTFLLCESDAGFFRLFGYGLGWRDTKKYPLLFSERNGYAKGFMLGNWRINIFTPGS